MTEAEIQEPVRDEEFYRSNLWIFYMLWLRGQGREADARQVCEEALQFNPEPRTRFHLGIALQREGLWEDAADRFRQVIAEESDHASAHIGLGAVLIELGRYDEAIEVLTIVPQISPKYSAAFDYMARALQHKGDTEAAIRAYRTSLAIYEYPGSLVALGDALREAGQITEALEVLTRATKNFPNAPHTHLALGKALTAAYRIREARQEWNRVLSLVAKYVKSPVFWEEKVHLDAEARRLLSETRER